MECESWEKKGSSAMSEGQRVESSIGIQGGETWLTKRRRRRGLVDRATCRKGSGWREMQL